jgi:hypothetical protein
MPQQLLSGDTATVIPADADDPEKNGGQHKHHKG